MLLLSVGNVQLKENNNSQLHRKILQLTKYRKLKENQKKSDILLTLPNKTPQNLNTSNIAKDRICALINAMWVAMSPLRVMAAPHTSQSLKWSFSICSSLSSSLTKYLMESHGVP